MVEVFTNVPPEGVNWSDSAAMITQEVKRLLDQPNRVRVEVTPARFYWEDNDRTQQVAVVAVYAPMRNKAEVQGIGMRLAFDKSDRVGLGLAGSQFHIMADLHKSTKTRNVILSTHASFLAKHSTCTIRAETHHLDKSISP